MHVARQRRYRLKVVLEKISFFKKNTSTSSFKEGEEDLKALGHQLGVEKSRGTEGREQMNKKVEMREEGAGTETSCLKRLEDF